MDKDRCLEKLTCTGGGDWRQSCHKAAETDGEASAERRVVEEKEGKWITGSLRRQRLSLSDNFNSPSP